MQTQTTAPELCPNPKCLFHSRRTAVAQQWYSRFGWFYTKARGWIQRFRCTACGRTCSTQTFSVHYWTHSTDGLVWLLHHLYGGGGLRRMARFKGASYRMIQNRIRRLARNALGVMHEALAEFSLTEDLAMDGLESYTHSRYHLNNITALGAIPASSSMG